MNADRPEHETASDGPCLLAGSGRSGTTWILDVLAKSGGSRTIFEPLHPAAISAAGPFVDRFIAPGDRHAALETLFNDAFEGRLRSVWTDYRVRPDRLRPTFAKLRSARETYRMLRRWKKLYRHYRRYSPTINHSRLIVKVIRANLMLSWLRRRFGTRTILVVRHPGAVVESQLRLGGPDWSPVPQVERYRQDEALVAHLDNRYQELLESELSAAAALTLIWCIQNMTPLADLKNNGATVIYYERLFSEPEQEWQRAMRAFGIHGEPDWDLVARPSEQASGISQQRKSVDATHLGRWLERIDPHALSEIESVLRHLDARIYSAGDPLPPQADDPATTSP